MNSKQLLFNWQLGRALVMRRVEETWRKGVVEQLSLDLQAEFPNVKGFSTSNLWYMKKWYQFYEPFLKREKLQQLVGEVVNTGNMRLSILVSLNRNHAPKSSGIVRYKISPTNLKAKCNKIIDNKWCV